MKIGIIKVIVLLLCMPVSVAAMADESFVTTAEGARYKDLQTGSGERVVVGDIVTMHFSGWLDNHGVKGKAIYNSRQERDPVSFVVGSERVMPGWNIGVIGMRPGGKRLLLLPPALGYGARAVEDIVPAHAGLIFVIDLIGVEKPPAHSD